MSKEISYPYISVDTTQAKGFYEVTIVLSREVSFSITLNEKKFAQLESDIKLIRRLQKQFRT